MHEHRLSRKCIEKLLFLFHCQNISTVKQKNRTINAKNRCLDPKLIDHRGKVTFTFSGLGVNSQECKYAKRFWVEPRGV